MATTTDTFLTSTQAAERLTTTREHVQDLIRAGALPAFNISLGAKARWRIALADLDAFIAARTHKPTTTSAPRRQRTKQKAKVDYFA